MTDIIRTPRDGCFELRSNTWGQFLHPCNDPDANATLEADALKSFELNEDITPIPADLWSRWVKLCFHFTGKVAATSEVSCRLLRHEDDKSQWRILVPFQEVDGAAVRVESFDEAIDIATGEVVTTYPPEHWVPCGSSHSHNTMGAFYSGTDDHYELGDPGLHIVVGNINVTKGSYAIIASITANKRRFIIDWPKVIDATPNAEPFHPDVLKAVTLGLTPRLWNTAANGQAKSAAKSKAKPQSVSLRSHPNSGNGYPADADERFNDLWFDDARFGGRLMDYGIDDIRTLVSEYADDCLEIGDIEGIDTLLFALRQLADNIQDAVYSDTIHDTTDPHETDTLLSALAGDSTAAQGLPTGQW